MSSAFATVMAATNRQRIDKLESLTAFHELLKLLVSSGQEPVKPSKFVLDEFPYIELLSLCMHESEVPPFSPGPTRRETSVTAEFLSSPSARREDYTRILFAFRMRRQLAIDTMIRDLCSDGPKTCGVVDLEFFTTAKKADEDPAFGRLHGTVTFQIRATLHLADKLLKP